MIILLDAIIRSSLVLATGLAAAWLLRTQPAALRHWILAATLALAAAQPVISRVLPALPVPSVSWSARQPVPEPTVETGFVIEQATPEPAPSSSESLNRPRMLILIWAAGVTISLSSLIAGTIWLMWLGSTASEAGGRWYSVADDLRARMGVSRSVRILVTTHPALLVTWGTISPVILLPADAPGWSPDRIRLVLAHELAHLARRDWIVQLAAEVARAFNWFNPLFWLACNALRRESEHACDDIVLDLGIGGTSYASHLLDLARTFSVHGRTWLPAPSIARPSTLERRVRAMLNPRLDRRPVSMMRRVALAAVLLCAALPIAAATQAMSTPSGTVSDPMGRPLADAVVRLSAVASSEQAYETRTDANGAFRFNAVTPGDYMISLRSPGFSGGRQRLQLANGEMTLALQARVGTLQETVSVRGGGANNPAGPRTEQSVPAPPSPSCSANGAGELTPPMKIHDVRPRYKQEWIDARLEGSILMQARIGVDGRVRSVDVISPVNADLEDEAVATVSQWQFSPSYLNCQPIEVQMYVTVSFKVEQ